MTQFNPNDSAEVVDRISKLLARLENMSGAFEGNKFSWIDHPSLPVGYYEWLESGGDQDGRKEFDMFLLGNAAMAIEVLEGHVNELNKIFSSAGSEC